TPLVLPHVLQLSHRLCEVPAVGAWNTAAPATRTPGSFPASSNIQTARATPGASGGRLGRCCPCHPVQMAC
ncbi:unnamed protein product, partial [Closterium sp. Naga37s-1]